MTNSMKEAVSYFRRMTDGDGPLAGMHGFALSFTSAKYNINPAELRAAIIEEREEASKAASTKPHSPISSHK